MCQHALCEHGKGLQQLKPAAPSILGRVREWMPLVAPLLVLLLLPTFGRAWLPLSFQLTALLGLVLVLVYRAATFPSVQLSTAARQELAADAGHQSWLRQSAEAKCRAQYAETLGAALRIPTVSFDKEDMQGRRTDRSQLLKLHELLAQRFPLVHAKLERTVINEYSLVFRWRSKNKSGATVKPILLCAHLDVVPVPDAHLWNEPPFSGRLVDGYICGRGAIDDKNAVIGLLSAAEDLLAEGWSPESGDIFLAFGHDEEIGGHEGAKHIAAWMTEQQLHFDFLLDEGLFVMQGILPGLGKQQVAMVCIAEKGSVTAEYTARVPDSMAGHASAPARESAIGLLARALVKMEDNPMPSYLAHGTPVRMMLESLAPHVQSWPVRILFANLWLFAPLLQRILAAKHTTATTLRTTTALTVVRAGDKNNVLPREARAVLNHRIHPLDSVDGVLHYSRRVVNDTRVELRVLDSIPPARVSSADAQSSRGFRTLQRALGRALPDALVAPGLMIGNTDTHHYWPLVDDIYRFTPTRMTPATVGMFHGANERIQLDNFVETIGFYRAVMQLSQERHKQ